MNHHSSLFFCVCIFHEAGAYNLIIIRVLNVSQASSGTKTCSFEGRNFSDMRGLRHVGGEAASPAPWKSSQSMRQVRCVHVSSLMCRLCWSAPFSAAVGCFFFLFQIWGSASVVQLDKWNSPCHIVTRDTVFLSCKSNHGSNLSQTITTSTKDSTAIQEHSLVILDRWNVTRWDSAAMQLGSPWDLFPQWPLWVQLATQSPGWMSSLHCLLRRSQCVDDAAGYPSHHHRFPSLSYQQTLGRETGWALEALHPIHPLADAPREHVDHERKPLQVGNAIFHFHSFSGPRWDSHLHHLLLIPHLHSNPTCFLVLPHSFPQGELSSRACALTHKESPNRREIHHKEFDSQNLWNKKTNYVIILNLWWSLEQKLNSFANASKAKSKPQTANPSESLKW